jgi:hypothetical protein
MNILRLLLKISFVLHVCHSAASNPTSVSIATSGETRLHVVLAGHRVDLKVWTHTVDIGKMGVVPPDVPHNNCTYSRVPCSVLEAIQIKVDDNAIFFPRSAFSDLSDLISIDIDAINGHFILTALGGDASEAYKVKVEFDTKRVTRRTMESGMDADKPTEITNYYEMNLDF